MLQLQKVHLCQGNKPICHSLDLNLAPGEILGILGESGIGKSSLIKAIAGIIPLESGRISWQNSLWAQNQQIVPLEKRRLGLVLQEAALFPHLSVRNNIAFGLKGLDKTTQNTRITQVLSWMEMEDFAHRMPQALSGGQAARVSLARAIAPYPQLLLLDEPFANLDPQLSQRIMSRLKTHFTQQGTSVILITHQRQEAQYFCQRILQLKNLGLEPFAA